MWMGLTTIPLLATCVHRRQPRTLLPVGAYGGHLVLFWPADRIRSAGAPGTVTIREIPASTGTSFRAGGGAAEPNDGPEDDGRGADDEEQNLEKGRGRDRDRRRTKEDRILEVRGPGGVQQAA